MPVKLCTWSTHSCRSVNRKRTSYVLTQIIYLYVIGGGSARFKDAGLEREIDNHALHLILHYSMSLSRDAKQFEVSHYRYHAPGRVKASPIVVCL